MTIWSRKKLELADLGDSESRFFIRLRGNESELSAQVKELFGDVKVVEVLEIDDEYAFITNKITEKAYNDKVSKLNNVLGMIRVEF